MAKQKELAADLARYLQEIELRISGKKFDYFFINVKGQVGSEPFVSWQFIINRKDLDQKDS